MSKSIIGSQWRVLALSFAVGLVVAANVASVARAAGTYSLFPVYDQDKYMDPQTGISLPDSPYLNGG